MSERDDDRGRSAPTGGTPDGEVYDWYHRGLDLLASGNPEAAAQLLEHAVADQPLSHSVREALARAQFDAGRYGEAAASFREITEADPADHYARFGLGLSLSRLGQHESAAEHLALAAAMRPDLPHYAEALRQARATVRYRDSGTP